jgi:hypothetical protein
MVARSTECIFGAGKRLGQNIFKETDATIQSFSDNLETLMQQFRDQVTRDAVIILHRSGKLALKTTLHLL